MANIFSWLFGGDDEDTQTQTSVSTSELPAWYQDYLKSTISAADKVASDPYTPYGGQRQAPVNADQTAAYDLTRSNVGIGNPNLSTAGSYLENAGSGFNEAEYNEYLSPYTEGVVDRIGDLGARNLSEKLLPQVNSTFTNAGQFGSSRHEDFTARAVRDANESTLGQQAAALESAQNKAMENYGRGQERTITAGQGLTDLAQRQQAAGLTDAAALQAVGADQQATDQKGYDLAYQDFIDQRDAPKKNVSFVSDIIRGNQPPASTTQTTTGPSNAPSPVSQLGGLALGSYGLYKAFAKKGGLMHKGIGKYAEGGDVSTGGGKLPLKTRRRDGREEYVEGFDARLLDANDEFVKTYDFLDRALGKSEDEEAESVMHRHARKIRKAEKKATGGAVGIGTYHDPRLTRMTRPDLARTEFRKGGRPVRKFAGGQAGIGYSGSAL